MINAVALAFAPIFLANLILDGKLETPYARNLLATIVLRARNRIYKRIAVEETARALMATRLAGVDGSVLRGSRN